MEVSYIMYWVMYDHEAQWVDQTNTHRTTQNAHKNEAISSE